MSCRDMIRIDPPWSASHKVKIKPLRNIIIRYKHNHV
jgi:hypothetical protein